jgi:hypothetical protein
MKTKNKKKLKQRKRKERRKKKMEMRKNTKKNSRPSEHQQLPFRNYCICPSLPLKKKITK